MRAWQNKIRGNIECNPPNKIPTVFLAMSLLWITLVALHVVLHFLVTPEMCALLTNKYLNNYITGAWWLSGGVRCLRCGRSLVKSLSSHHVETLGNFFALSCLYDMMWC